MSFSPRLTASTAITLIAAHLAAQDWALQSQPTQPPGATLPRMAYDSQRARCVVFGGWNAPTGSIVFQDTWEYDGNAWLLRTPATIPDERESHMMAYDSARGRTVMFGGWDFNFVRLGQTWEWNGTNWQNRLPANAPSARILGAMAYDSGRGVTVLFGGDDAISTLGDTWEWNGTNWSQRSPATSPSPRTGHAMAYDAARNRVVLFGGFGSSQLDDTWEYDGNNWTLIATDGAPTPRADHQLAYDSQRGRVVLFGGADALLELDDTWEYGSRGWRQLFTTNQPQGNAAMAMAYDSARGRTVVFGGFDGTAAIQDTWELGGNAATYRTFGTGCDGSNGLPPRLEPQNMPTLGTTTSVDITDLPGSSGFVFLAGGLSDLTWGGLQLPIDLSSIGLTGCRAYISPDVGVVLAHTAGTATWSLAVPVSPSLSGYQMFLQALSLDPAVTRPFQGAMSNAAELNVR